MSDRSSESIHDTVFRLQQGDQGALQQLLHEHLPWIEARVRNRLSAEVRREGDTQDFVQEALLEVLRDGPRFSIDNPAAFRALLARIVENTLIDRQRYMHRERRDRRREKALPTDSVLQLDKPVESVTAPSAHAERSEQQAWLRLALELLDPDDREVIRLRDWEELSFAEVATALGIQDEAARKRYRRALPRLAQKLELLRRGRWQDSLDQAPPPPPPRPPAD
ncbi:MAG: RNA polymerase sigma factor [Planctomycetota bacterium]